MCPYTWHGILLMHIHSHKRFKYQSYMEAENILQLSPFFYLYWHPGQVVFTTFTKKPKYVCMWIGSSGGICPGGKCFFFGGGGVESKTTVETDIKIIQWGI